MGEQQELHFDAPSDDPVAVYLASGLTSLNDDQLTIVEIVSGLIAEFCAEVGVMVHQPMMHTHPRDHANLEANKVHAKDFAKVVESDAVIAIGDFASWGAGKELAWAERLRMPVLLLCRENHAMSRLVRGTTGDFELATWRFHDDIREAWTTYFTERRAQLEAHRRLRAGRKALWAPTLDLLRASHALLSTNEKRETAAIAHLTSSRIHEMLSSPGALAEASIDEVQALIGALGLPATAGIPSGQRPHLPPRALSALATAAELEGWDGRYTVELYQRATLELAKGGTRRLRFNEPTDWIDFDA